MRGTKPVAPIPASRYDDQGSDLHSVDDYLDHSDSQSTARSEPLHTYFTPSSTTTPPTISQHHTPSTSVTLPSRHAPDWNHLQDDFDDLPPSYEEAAQDTSYPYSVDVQELSRASTTTNLELRVNRMVIHDQTAPPARINIRTDPLPLDTATTINNILTRALGFTTHAPASTERSLPRLPRPIVIPHQLHLSLPTSSTTELTETATGFARAYAKPLHDHSITTAEFLSFVDGLNVLTTSRMLAHFHPLTEDSPPAVYLKRANEEFFAPRGLKVSILFSGGELCNALDISGRTNSRVREVESRGDTGYGAKEMVGLFGDKVEALAWNVPPKEQRVLELEGLSARLQLDDEQHPERGTQPQAQWQGSHGVTLGGRPGKGLGGIRARAMSASTTSSSSASSSSSSSSSDDSADAEHDFNRAYNEKLRKIDEDYNKAMAEINSKPQTPWGLGMAHMRAGLAMGDAHMRAGLAYGFAHARNGINQGMNVQIQPTITQPCKSKEQYKAEHQRNKDLLKAEQDRSKEQMKAEHKRLKHDIKFINKQAKQEEKMAKWHAKHERKEAKMAKWAERREERCQEWAERRRERMERWERREVGRRVRRDCRGFERERRRGQRCGRDEDRGEEMHEVGVAGVGNMWLLVENL